MAVSRRSVLKTAAAAAAVTIVPRHVLGGPRFVAPSEKVNVALIGAGGQGRTNIRQMYGEPDCQIIAIADPVEQWDLEPFYYKGQGGRGPVKAEVEKTYAAKTPNFKCATYEDFREMLEKEKAIDAVLCATPDHLHAYVTLYSMKAGKHVFCEKPLTHNIAECRRVAQVAKETGVATQMGNIGHSREGMRETVEWLWDGVVGTVREVHAWVGAMRWNPHLTGLPDGSPPTPAGINWDLWLGPREPHPYNPAYCPVKWRDFWAFGTGSLGDFGCHDLDAAMWALDLAKPETIEALPAGYTDHEIAPQGEICYYSFGPRGDKPPLKVTWYDGGLKPQCPAVQPEGRSLPDRGILFIGDKGVLLAEGAGGQPRLLPIEKTRDYKKPPKTLKRSKGHHRDWLDACKGGPAASANFEYGAKLTEIVLLGILSMRTRQRIFWNSAEMKADGLAAADAIIHEPRRKGWELA